MEKLKYKQFYNDKKKSNLDINKKIEIDNKTPIKIPIKEPIKKYFQIL